ncbi:MAG: hypothetical protein IPP72_00500 [Chitinophagaceae bacterium]|nr:hypothetical protein [Chitinophagaceae bacterium]
MKRAILLFTCFLIYTFSIAQAPAIDWQKSLGGTAADEAKSVVPTSDGGYIVGGTTLSNDGDVTGNHGGKDCWVVKLNATGGIEWQKTYGGTGNETFGSIRVTTDGGYIMGAATTSNYGDVSGSHGYGEAWVVKLSSTGTIEWQKCFGSSSGDILNYVEETFDGGFICLGEYGTNDGDVPVQSVEYGGSWMFKLDNARNIVWQKALYNSGGIGGGTGIYAIRQTKDSGFVYNGYNPGGTGNGFVIKINSAGTYVASDYVNPQAPGMYEFLAPKCIAPTNDGGCIAVRRDQWTYYQALRKYNNAMVLQWERQFELFGEATNITTTPDGGYVVTGYLSSGNMPGAQGGSDFWLAKVNSTGILQWQRLLGSAGGDNANWAEPVGDSSYIVAGKGAANSGDITGNHGGDDFWVVRLSHSSPGFAIISSAGANGTISPNGGIIYPTGTNQTFTITPNTGYHIANVLVDGISNAGAVSSGTYTFTNVNASHTISATFAINTYTLVSSSGANGSISPSGSATVNYGSSKSYAITPSAGYSVLDIKVDGVHINPVNSYTFNGISANHTISALFANRDSALTFVCTGSDSGTITSNISGNNYKWQINSGSGYVVLSDGYYFGGTSTPTLTIRYYGASALGYRYRCVVDNAGSYEFVLRYKDTWTGAFDNHWEIPQNWSCSKIPDANTDVVIPAGSNMIISTNITIRSLSLGIGANVTVAPGGNLTVLH